MQLFVNLQIKGKNVIKALLKFIGIFIVVLIIIAGFVFGTKNLHNQQATINLSEVLQNRIEFIPYSVIHVETLAVGREDRYAYLKIYLTDSEENVWRFISFCDRQSDLNLLDSFKFLVYKQTKDKLEKQNISDLKDVKFKLSKNYHFKFSTNETEFKKKIKLLFNDLDIEANQIKENYSKNIEKLYFTDLIEVYNNENNLIKTDKSFTITANFIFYK